MFPFLPCPAPRAAQLTRQLLKAVSQITDAEPVPQRGAAAKGQALTQPAAGSSRHYPSGRVQAPRTRGGGAEHAACTAQPVRPQPGGGKEAMQGKHNENQANAGKWRAK